MERETINLFLLFIKAIKNLARLRGFEPPTYGSGVRRSIH